MREFCKILIKIYLMMNLSNLADVFFQFKKNKVGNFFKLPTFSNFRRNLILIKGEIILNLLGYSIWNAVLFSRFKSDASGCRNCLLGQTVGQSVDRRNASNLSAWQKGNSQSHGSLNLIGSRRIGVISSRF